MDEKIVKLQTGMHYRDIQKTIDAALLPKIQKLNYQDENDLPDMEWICYSLGLRRGGTFLLTGYSNAGKTFFSTYLALAVQNNLPVLNYELEQSGKVLHLDWELGEDAGLYYYKIKNGLMDELGSNINPVDYIDMRREFHLDDTNSKEVEQRLIKICEGYTLVIVDSLIAAISKTDINDDRCRAYLDLLARVAAATNSCFIIIHHEGKGTVTDNLKRGKGSSSIMAAVRGSISLERQKNNEIKLMTGKLRLSKSVECFYTLDDWGEYSEKLRSPCGIKLVVVGESENKPVAHDELKSKILTLIQNAPGINQKAIVYQSKCRKQNALDVLKEIEDNKLVNKTKNGKTNHYTINSDGISYLQYGDSHE